MKTKHLTTQDRVEMTKAAQIAFDPSGEDNTWVKLGQHFRNMETKVASAVQPRPSRKIN